MPNTAPSSRSPLTGWISLSIIYVVWGSTYLGIRITMAEGSGFTPFALGASRCAVSGTVLLAIVLFKNRKSPIRFPSRRDLLTVFISALTMWIGGNALVMIAERHVDSGTAALLVGTIPLWMTVIDAIWDRHRPGLLLIVSMLLGFSGLTVLTLPLLRHGTHADIVSAALLLIAPLSWAFGSVIQARRPMSLSPTGSAAALQWAAAVLFFLLALIARDPFPSPTPKALAAAAYLAIMGGVVAFTAYLVALKLLPTATVSTYAYANPVIAVFLGFLILDETITIYTVTGSALILLGIFGVFQSKKTDRKRV